MTELRVYFTFVRQLSGCAVMRRTIIHKIKGKNEKDFTYMKEFDKKRSNIIHNVVVMDLPGV